MSQVDLKNEKHLENISALSYIKQCIEEGMRLYPPAYYIDRMSIEEDQLDEHTIPKNTMLLLAIYELHRDSNFWDAPDEFKPERFDPSGKKDFQEYYYPFGAGPRMCVGNNFATYEMVLTVAEILKNYRITSNLDNVEVNPMISLRPKKVPLVFIPRD